MPWLAEMENEKISRDTGPSGGPVANQDVNYMLVMVKAETPGDTLNDVEFATLSDTIIK